MTYRLLSIGEQILPTDEYFDHLVWRAFGDSKYRVVVDENHLPIRRVINISPIDLSEEISPWCLHCKEADCIVGESTCEMIRVYLKAKVRAL